MKHCNGIMRTKSGNIIDRPCCLNVTNLDSKLRGEHSLAVQDLQRQTEHIQRTMEGDAARARSRHEAEIADLKAIIASLEISLEKVCL